MASSSSGTPSNCFWIFSPASGQLHTGCGKSVDHKQVFDADLVAQLDALGLVDEGHRHLVA